MHWLAHLLGLDDESGPFYAFWSGAGGDLALVTLPFTGYVLWRKHSCHVDWCWRVGRHRVEGTQWMVCRRHHPDDRLTHHDVMAKSEELKNHG